MQVQVTGTNYCRDTQTKALINKDINGLEDYRTKRKFAEMQKHEINNIKTEVENIKSDVLEIKQMLCQLLNKGSNG